MRVLDFRTGAGLSFRVVIDPRVRSACRGLPRRADRLRSRPGRGIRPRLGRENRGWGFLRSFTGLLATCGLDQALAPRLPAWRSTSIRGSARATIRCTAGSRRCRRVLWATASAGRSDVHAVGRRRGRSDAVFGENLVLTRRIEAALGDTTITVEDRVENRGFRPTRTCCSTTTISVTRCSTKAPSCWCRAGRSCAMHGDLHAQGVGYRIQGPAGADFSEQVYEHDVVAGPDGMASAC